MPKNKAVALLLLCFPLICVFANNTKYPLYRRREGLRGRMKSRKKNKQPYRKWSSVIDSSSQALSTEGHGLGRPYRKAVDSRFLQLKFVDCASELFKRDRAQNLEEKIEVQEDIEVEEEFEEEEEEQETGQETKSSREREESGMSRKRRELRNCKKARKRGKRTRKKVLNAIPEFDLGSAAAGAAAGAVAGTTVGATIGTVLGGAGALLTTAIGVAGVVSAGSPPIIAPPTTEAPIAPTRTPTQEPTLVPTTQSPTSRAPTQMPTTLSPTVPITGTPTQSPTKTPTQSPTKAPTQVPTQSPTKAPSQSPTKFPSQAPTLPVLIFVGVTPGGLLNVCEGDCDFDTDCAAGLQCYQRSSIQGVPPGCSGTPFGALDYCYDPTFVTARIEDPYRDPLPLQNATQSPASQAPTMMPTTLSSKIAVTGTPTQSPTKAPTQSPTQSPTNAPTQLPTRAPTQLPTNAPTQSLTRAPSQAPTLHALTFVGISPVGLLNVCESDCDLDADCAAGLRCFQRSSIQEGPPGCSGTPIGSLDYCYDPNQFSLQKAKHTEHSTVFGSEFALNFEVPQGAIESGVTAMDFSEVEFLTELFLKEIVKMRYESKTDVHFVDYRISGSDEYANAYEGVLSVTFHPKADFSLTSIRIPTRDEIDYFAMGAFTFNKSKTGYLNFLDSLGTINPFSLTKNVTFETFDELK